MLKRIVFEKFGVCIEGIEGGSAKRIGTNQYKSVTTAEDLNNLAICDKDPQNIFNWLTTSDIIFRVNANLNQIFKPAEVDRVRSSIFSYFDEYATYAGAIQPRQLLYELKDYLQTNINRWTLFQTNGSSWSISGIHDLEDNSEIERPSIIVPALWSTGNPNARRLVNEQEHFAKELQLSIMLCLRRCWQRYR